MQTLAAIFLLIVFFVGLFEIGYETAIVIRQREQDLFIRYLHEKYGADSVEELRMKYLMGVRRNVSMVFEQGKTELKHVLYMFPTQMEFFEQRVERLNETEREIELMFNQQGTRVEVKTEQTYTPLIYVALNNILGCNVVLITFPILGLSILAAITVREPESKRSKKAVRLLCYILLLFAVALLSYRLGYVYGQKSSLMIQIEPRSFTEDSAYIVFEEEGVIYAKNGKTGEIEFSGTNAATVIQSVFNNLTPNKTWKERVVFIGEFILNLQITIPSYTILDMSYAVLKLSDDINLAGEGIIKLSNASHIDIIGGVLDANYPTNSYFNKGVFLENCTYVVVRGVYMKYFATGIEGNPVYKSIFVDNIIEGHSTRSSGIDIVYGDDNEICSNLVINGLINLSRGNKTAGGPELHRNKIHGNICIGLMSRGNIRIYDWSHETSIKNNIVMPYTGQGGIYGYASERCEVIGNIVIGRGGTGGNGIDFAGSKHILWEDNIVYNIGGNGFATDGTSHIIIKGNIAAYCGKNGFELPYATPADRKVILIGNMAYNNGQSGTGHGISISNSRYVMVISNICFNDQASKTQDYGIALWDDCSYSIIKGNICFDNVGNGIYVSGNNTVVEGNIARGNRWGITINGNNIQVLSNQLLDNTDANFNDEGGTGRVIRGNVGYITENSGIATNLANGDYIVHNLVDTPSVVILTCLNATYGGVPVIVSWNKELTNSTHIAVNIYWANGTAVVDPVIAVSWYAEV